MNEGKIYFICGASRNGKTAYVMMLIKGMLRVVVWDIEGEFAELPGFTAVSSLQELKDRMKTAGRGNLKVAFQPRSLDQFSDFSRLALAWGQDCGALTVVAEETSDVTSPGKAPHGWGQLIRKGMKRGITTVAITQRPAESDKTALGNAKFIISFHLNRPGDQRYIADELGCTQEEIASLQKLHYIKKDIDARKITTGKLNF